jgi:membrane protein DedA with SNARE-associated domain
MTESLIDILSHFHYLGLFGILLLCGIGLPIPEDLVIVTGGYFAYLGYTKLGPTIFVLYAGALIGDLSLYGIGRRFGPDIIAHRRLTWLFTSKRIHAINHYFHRFGNLTLFFARFLVGLRSTIFLSAGAFKISFKKMLLFDGAAATLSIPFITYLAYRFGGELDDFLVWLHRIEHSLVALSVLIVVILIFWIRHRIKEKEAMPILNAEKLEIPTDKQP